MTNSVYTPETKKLRRSRSDKMLTGVCGGWATYLGIDANVLRIGMVAAVFLSRRHRHPGLRRRRDPDPRRGLLTRAGAGSQGEPVPAGRTGVC